MDTIGRIWGPGYHLPASIAVFCGKRISAFMVPEVSVPAGGLRMPLLVDAQQTALRPSVLRRGT